VNTTPNQWEYIITTDPESDFRSIEGISVVGNKYAGLLMRGALTFDPATGLVDTSNPDAITAEVLTDFTTSPPVWSGDNPLTALTPSNTGYFSLTANFINGGEAQSIEVSFGAKNPLGLGDWTPETLTISQFASASATNSQTQDGYASGTLEGMNVATDGTVHGTYSNGRTLGLYQVALALFKNPGALEKLGQNLYRESIDSGSPTVAPPGTGGAGEVHANALEQSNVDLAKEFVDMIVIQRGYQANSKSITTADTLLAELLQLKR
jgi:flagellar hook protein FlgE